MLYLSHSLCSVLARSNSVFVPTDEDTMELIDFILEFPNEESCENKLREYREKQGVACHDLELRPCKEAKIIYTKVH